MLFLSPRLFSHKSSISIFFFLSFLITLINLFYIYNNKFEILFFLVHNKKNFFSKIKFQPMYKLWKTINDSNLSQSQIYDFFYELYPFAKMNQKVFFFDPSRHVEKYDDQGIYGTKQVQKLIYTNQYPKNCFDRNFIVIYRFENSGAGIGAMLHNIAGILGYGLDKNKTIIYYPNSFSILSSSNSFAKAGLDCFFEEITNCSFSANEIDSNHKKFEKISITNYSKFFYTPNSILPWIKKTATPLNLFNFYWKIQATFFLVRFNENMKVKLNDLRYKYLINPKDQYDVAINVRHGDKYLEMKLINTQDYVFALELLYKMLGRKLLVFISSDEESAIQYLLMMDRKKYEISYINKKRPSTGYNMKTLKNGFNNSLLSYADLTESIKAKYLIGTLSSNWNRLILELRLQHGSYMDLPYFEVGRKECLTPNQCVSLNFSRNYNWLK